MATAAEVEFWKDMCRKESARNNKLRSEWNEAIRQQLAADDARKTAEAVANGLEWEVEEFASENAKLRELVADAWCYINHPADATWTHKKRKEVRDSIADRMRELEIEMES